MGPRQSRGFCAAFVHYNTHNSANEGKDNEIKQEIAMSSQRQMPPLCA